MPFCPHCKTEYDEGFFVCADCGSRLIDALPEEKPRVIYGGPMKRAFLVSVSDSTQGAPLIDVLNQNGIPAFMQKKGAGGYLGAYMGYSIYGEDIYVDEADLASARGLAEDFLQPAEPEGRIEFSPNPVSLRIRALLVAVWIVLFCL